VPPSADTLPPSILIGRETEMRELSAWWAAACAGTGGPLEVVAGESGVGKSRLVREFATEARTAGAHVLVGAATDHGFLPYEPWVGAIRSFVDHASPQLRDLIVTERATELASLPWLRDLVRSDTSSLHLVPDESGVAGVVRGILETLAESGPVLIVIEDAHWSDRGSVDLIVRILEDPPPRCGLVIVERRPTTGAGWWDKGPDRLPPHSELVVGRLDAHACSDLLEAYAPHVASDLLADAVFDASAGNPLVALSLIELVSRSPEVARETADQLPATAGAIWAARFSPLSPSSRRILSVAAVAGTASDLGWLIRTVGDEAAIRLALDEARGAGLIHPDETTEVRFGHALLREHLYLSLTTTRRRRIHRRLASTLSAPDDAAPSVASAQLAHHWRESGPSSRHEELRHTIAAARWSFAQGSSDAATDLCDRALETIAAIASEGLLEADALAGRRAELGDLLLRIAHPGAVEVMLTAVGHYRGTDDVVMLARMADALMRAGQFVGSADAGTALAADLVDQLDRVDPALHSHILARLTRAREGGVTPVEELEELSVRALALARTVVDDDDTLALALFCYCTAQPWTDERLVHLLELVDLGRTRHNDEYLAHGLNYLYVLLAARGEIDAADDVLIEVVEVERRIPPGYAGVIRNAELSKETRSLIIARRCVQAQLAGHLDEQERCIAELLPYLGEPDVERDRLLYVVMTQQGLLWHDRGGPEEFADLAVSFAQELPESTQRQVCAAFVLAESSMFEECRRLYEPIRRGEFRDVTIDLTTGFILMLLARTSHRLGDAAGAALVQRRLAPFTGQNPCFIGGGLGPADLGLALCAATAGRHDEALRFFHDALDQCARWRMPGIAARAHLDRARMLSTSSSTRTASLTDAREAIARSVPLGIHAVAREATALAERLGDY
jgi:hypothetical protein